MTTTTLAIYSDFHIGTKENNDDFKIDEKLFIEYINASIKKYDIVIFNGDVFELWQGKSWNNDLKTFDNIREARPLITNYIINSIKASKIEYIIGNHDWILYQKQIIPLIKSHYSYNSPNGLIWIEHGHKPDIFNNRWSIFGKFITWITGWIERCIYNDIDIKIAKLLDLNITANTSRLPYIKYAEKLIKKMNLNIIALGHTHRPYRQSITVNNQHKPCIASYIDTGKCCDSNHLDETIIRIGDTNNTIYQYKRTL